MSEVDRRIPELDGLRGLAMALVFAFHIFWFPFSFQVFAKETSGFGFWLQNLALSGWVGVDLFFALSGYLITKILLEQRQRQGVLWRFYWRRALRIFPPYFLLLLFWSYYLQEQFPSSLSLGSEPLASLSLWTYTGNWLIAFKGWSALPMALSHVWTLAIEEQFYWVWPLLIVFVSPRWTFWICLGLLLLAPGLRTLVDPLTAYVSTPLRLDALAGGAALALYPGRPKGAAWIFAGLALTVLGLLIWRQGLAGEDKVILYGGLTALTLCFTAAIALCLEPKAKLWRSFFRLAPLRFLGKYSYGIYLFHQPILLYLLVHEYRGFGLYALESVALAIALAWLSFHLFEKRILAFKGIFG